MYMGVILEGMASAELLFSIPHVYGGDPQFLRFHYLPP